MSGSPAWRLFAWAWVLCAFPLKLIESCFVGRPVLSFAAMLTQNPHAFGAGCLASLMLQVFVLLPLKFVGPTSQSLACPVYVSALIWTSAHLVVTAVVAALVSHSYDLELLWVPRVHSRYVCSLVPIPFETYAGFALALALGYPFFVIPPPGVPIFSWCTLVPNWAGPDGLLFAVSASVASFAATVRVAVSRREIARHAVERDGIRSFGLSVQRRGEHGSGIEDEEEDDVLLLDVDDGTVL